MTINNQDKGLLCGVASAMTGGLAIMRTVDRGVGKSVLKKIGDKQDPLSIFRKQSALNTLKGSKWQIPVFAITSLATGLLAKHYFEA